MRRMHEKGIVDLSVQQRVAVDVFHKDSKDVAVLVACGVAGPNRRRPRRGGRGSMGLVRHRRIHHQHLSHR